MSTTTTKCYTMDKPGIEVRDGLIHIGEAGRGRKLVTIPVPAGAEIVDRTETIRYRILALKDEREINARTGDPQWAAKMLVDGHYNDYSMEPARLEKEIHWSGRVLSLESTSGGVIVRIPDQSGFRGGWAADLSQGATKIAEGFCAQGDAGRMGGGPDMLVRLLEGASVTIRRHGRRVTPVSILRNVCGAVVLEQPDLIAATTKATEALLS